MWQKILFLKKMLPRLWCTQLGFISVWLAIAPFIFVWLSLFLSPTKFVECYLQDKSVVKISFLQEKNLCRIHPNPKRGTVNVLLPSLVAPLFAGTEALPTSVALCTLGMKLLQTFWIFSCDYLHWDWLLPTSVVPV